MGFKHLKTRKLMGTLVVLAFFLTVLFASQNIVAVSQGTTLTVYSTTEAITIDGEASESAWNSADVLTIPNVDSSGVNVTLKALTDGTYLYVYATWSDTTKDETRKGWSFNGTAWSNVGGNEDRISIAWNLGSTIVCGHNPGTNDTMLFDIWHWKAARTALAGWADDKYWDGSGRQSDAKTAGGYSDNSVVAQAGGPAAVTAALGNSTPVTAFSDEDRPYWDNGGSVISWTNGVNSTPIGDFVHGYKSIIPTGSRGDVITGSLHNGTAWEVEFKRALNTGNADDDVAFSAGNSIPFHVAVHNNSGGPSHFIAGGFTPITFQLSIPSVSTTTDTTTTTTTSTGPTTTDTTPPDPDMLILAAVAIGGVVVVILVIAVVRRGR
jgi:hypothetical protein